MNGDDSKILPKELVITKYSRDLDVMRGENYRLDVDVTMLENLKPENSVIKFHKYLRDQKKAAIADIPNGSGWVVFLPSMEFQVTLYSPDIPSDDPRTT